MLKKPNGYDDVELRAKLPRLPIGGYVIEIRGYKVENYSFGDVLVLAFDIVEGEYTGFYEDNFARQTTEDKKWKGTIRLNIPDDDSEEWAVRSFKSNMRAFETSNEGFVWHWDESKLKGLKVGALFRNKEWAGDNGSGGWYTECFMLYDADMIRSGDFEMPKDKPLKRNENAGGFADTAPTQQSAPFGTLNDDDIPF